MRTAAALHLEIGNHLHALTPAPYAAEEHLQSLISAHPRLLGGEQMEEIPRRFFLLSAEAAIADGVDAPDRWSIDHLFIDQEAIPTFIEVKRSSDPRIRREVVGQLIEYATNGAAFWKPGHLEALARSRFPDKAALEAALVALIGSDGVPLTEFWSEAEKNLRTGKVRLMFVADQIPPELLRMAQFLNDQMTHAEVLAVEIRQFVSESGSRALSSEVLNVTEEARAAKSTGSGRNRWTEGDFDAHCSKLTPPTAAAVKLVYEKLKSEATSVNYGSGKLPTFNPRLLRVGPGSPLTLSSDGTLSLNYGYIGGSDDALQKRARFLALIGPLLKDPAPSFLFPRYSAEVWTPHAVRLIEVLSELNSPG